MGHEELQLRLDYRVKLSLLTKRMKELIMKLHLKENMKVNDQELLKTHSLMENILIGIENYRSLNMNTLVEVQQMLTIFYQSTWVVKVATQLYVYLR